METKLFEAHPQHLSQTSGTYAKTPESWIAHDDLTYVGEVVLPVDDGMGRAFSYFVSKRVSCRSSIGSWKIRNTRVSIQGRIRGKS